MIPKKDILNWFKDEGALYKKENVYHAERIFFASSALSWCVEQKKQNKISEKDINSLVRLLRLFLKKKVDLSWGNGIIKVRSNKSAARRKENGTNASDSVAS